MASQLGIHVFFRLENLSSRDGTPGVVRQVNEILQRGGVDGTGIRRMGIKGDPFQMRSIVDVTNRAAALALKAQYTVLCEQGPLTLIHDGVNYDAGGLRFGVLDVGDFSESKFAVGTGGIFTTLGSSGIWLGATWTLIPLDFT